MNFTDLNIEEDLSLIVVFDNSYVRLNHADLNENQGKDGIISIEDNSTLIVEDSEFTLNHAFGNGGCFVMKNESRLFILNSAFTNNSAENHGGIIYTEFNTKTCNCKQYL